MTNLPASKDARITPTGFREYDARWLFPDEINLQGLHALGRGLGELLGELLAGAPVQIIVGHDYRSYSEAVKQSLVAGLMEAGAQVIDIGLALSPTAYFAQFACDVPAVAMVTASHNENGWTGVKMGAARPLTFGAEEMARLKEKVLNSKPPSKNQNGTYRAIDDMAAQYKRDLTNRAPFARKIKAVVACGNGTAGAFAPEVLRTLGVEVVPLHCELDYNFPHHNPNPEDIAMLHALSKCVLENAADIGFAFDGDGDRCGVVDNKGREIFADKMGVLIARDLARKHKNAHFVVDVKSTSLFASDSVLRAAGATTEYWKTGHSYMKRRTFERNALAGFEKSGHFFFNAPIGRGYDDGILASLVICDLLADSKKDMAELYDSLPLTFSSPTMSPFCADEKKYEVVAQASKILRQKKTLLAQNIIDINEVNGIRLTLEDGTWGLIRASSNKPSLVVVVESPASAQNMRAMFHALDDILRTFPEVGDYDQKLE